MEFSTMRRCVALLVSLALLPLLGMAADSIGSYCAGSSYAGSNKAVASINAVLPTSSPRPPPGAATPRPPPV